MKKSRIFMGVILALLMVFTVSAFELDTAESAGAAVLAEDLGELVFSVDFEGLTSIASGNTVTKTSADFGSSNVIIYNGGMSMVYGLGKPVSSGSQMLSMATNAYHGCVRFQGFTLNKPGTYTLTYDRYYANAVAYQSCAINAAPSTTQSVHASATIQNISTSLVLKEGDSAISYVQIQFAKYQSGIATSPVYIDNVKLYYKAPGVSGTAMVMYGDSEDDVLESYPDIESGETITMPSASDMAEYTPDGKFFKGFTVNGTSVAPGAVFTVTEELAKTGTFYFYPVFVDIPDAGYGELVFFEDFEGMNGAVANGGYLPDLMMGAFAGKKVQFYDSGAGSSYEIASPIENGTKMIKVSGGNYPQINFINLGLSKPGTYTFMYDYYLTEATGISFIQSGIDSVEKFDYVKGSVQTVMHTKTLSEGESISKFNIQTGFTNPAIYIDNLRIYYSVSAAPVAVKANSIRTTGYTGLRFVSFANKAVRVSAAEYGYMVAFKDDSVPDYNTALVFADGERTEGVAVTNEFGVKYLFAANYIEDIKDVIYSENGDFLPENLSMGDDGVYFTAVMINIPEQAYNKQLVVRPYAVIGGKIFYGNVVSKSLYEAAVEMKNSEGYTENEFVESIIAAVENA